jgi:outer membrane protein assembly factor BamA
LKHFLFISTLFLFFISTASAQKNFQLKIEQNDAVVNPAKLNYEKKFRSANEREKEIQQLLLHLYGKGYLAASIDSISEDSLLLTAYFTIGETYKWAKLRTGTVDEGMLSQSGYREKIFFQKKINFKQSERMLKRILSTANNQGYPFANIKLDSIEFNKNEITASILLNKGKYITIDSIIIKGDAKINPIYIYTYIGIKPGDAFNQTQLSKVSTRIKELAFVKENKAFELLFSTEANKLYLFLDKKKASNFDGILGILPDDNNPGQILLTGDIRLKLLNPFGRGELIDINFRKLQTQTQDLKTNFIYPYLFRTPLAFEGRFDLYRRDTSFINLNRIGGLQYLFSGGNYIKAYVQSKNSSIISVEGLENLNSLPDYADSRSLMYGLGFKIENTDYRLNPTKGFRAQFNGAGGNRKILKHPKIKEQLYDNIELSTIQYDTEFNGDIFIPLIKRTTLRIGQQTAYLITPNAFENELYRIGGFRTLRGFDEESIFASFYTITHIEYRYLLEQNSYAYIFWNGAYYENRSVNKFIHDTPHGFGLGLSFETKAGIFSLNYAIGKQFNNPIDIRAAKIHFGIISFF